MSTARLLVVRLFEVFAVSWAILAFILDWQDVVASPWLYRYGVILPVAALVILFIENWQLRHRTHGGDTLLRDQLERIIDRIGKLEEQPIDYRSHAARSSALVFEQRAVMRLVIDGIKSGLVDVPIAINEAEEQQEKEWAKLAVALEHIHPEIIRVAEIAQEQMAAGDGNIVNRPLEEVLRLWMRHARCVVQALITHHVGVPRHRRSSTSRAPTAPPCVIPPGMPDQQKHLGVSSASPSPPGNAHMEPTQS